MTTAFPGAVDNFTNPTATDKLDSVTVPHADQHANLNDAVEAVETYVLALSNPVFGLTSGLYYSCLRTSTSLNQATSLNLVTYSPISFGQSQTFDRIALTTGTTYSGTGAVRLGIYDNDPTTGKPTTVVLDAGTVATTAANTNYEITISQTLSAGTYWLAFVVQTLATTNNFVGTVTSLGVGAAVTTSGTSNTTGCFTQSGVSGAFTTAGTLTSAAGALLVSLRST